MLLRVLVSGRSGSCMRLCLLRLGSDGLDLGCFCLGFLRKVPWQQCELNSKPQWNEVSTRAGHRHEAVLLNSCFFVFASAHFHAFSCCLWPSFSASALWILLLPASLAFCFLFPAPCFLLSASSFLLAFCFIGFFLLLMQKVCRSRTLLPFLFLSFSSAVLLQ